MKMKVFVYSKKNNDKIATIKDVQMILNRTEKNVLQIVTEDGEIFEFNIKTMKVVIYQN